MQDFKDGSNPYRLGRLGRLPRQQVIDTWTADEVRDYEQGKKDRAKLRRKQGRKDVLVNIFAGIAAVIAIIGTILVWAFVAALPFIFAIGFLALIGVI